MGQTDTPSVWITRVLAALQIALLALSAFFIARMVIIWTTPDTVWKARPVVEVPASAASQRKAQTFNFIFDPFHRDVVVSAQDIGEDAPETTLNLTLTGLRASEFGTAFIKTPDNTERPYRIGDEIMRGVTLKAVTADYVVLEQDGQVERLTIERDMKGMGRERETTSAQSPTSGIPPKVAQAISMTDFKPEDLLSAVSLTRVSEGARVKGYRITPKASGFDLKTLGLQSGDIVTHIGEADLTQGRPEFAPILANLAKTNSTSLTLIRGNRTLTLRIGS